MNLLAEFPIALEPSFVADLAVIRPEAIWIVDYKTDDLTAGELPSAVARYAPQLRLYALALTRIYRRPVTEAWLHFLALGRSERVV